MNTLLLGGLVTIHRLTALVVFRFVVIPRLDLVLVTLGRVLTFSVTRPLRGVVGVLRFAFSS